MREEVGEDKGRMSKYVLSVEEWSEWRDIFQWPLFKYQVFWSLPSFSLQ